MARSSEAPRSSPSTTNSKLHEQSALMAHSRPKVLITEYPIWRKLAALKEPLEVEHILVTEAPESADLGDAKRWEDLPEAASPSFIERAPEDIATIVYSSGTGGAPKAAC